MRDHCNREGLRAHAILDLARAGGDVPLSAICWALFVLGDGVGLVKINKGQ